MGEATDDPPTSTSNDVSPPAALDAAIHTDGDKTTSVRASLPRRSVMAMSLSKSVNLSDEFLVNLSTLVKEDKYDAATNALFDSIDTNKTGTLERDELFFFLKEASTRINLKVQDEVIHLAIDALIVDVGGEEDSHSITREQFLQIFQRNPDMYRAFDTEESMSERVKSSRTRLSQQEIKEQELEDEQLWEHAKTHWKNQRLAVVWILLYAAACIATFVNAAIKWANDEAALAVFGNCIVVARASAATINLNAALILLPICRHALTWLRSTYARFFFPFDASIEVHMLIGVVFALFASSHTLAHVCDYVRIVDSTDAEIEALFGDALGPWPTTKAGRWGLMMKQPATITGILMVICLSVAYIALRNRRQHFNRFWYLHHLLIIMLILMCVHGTGNLLQPFQSVYWICGPLALYIVPRIYREVSCRSAKIRGVNIHDDVLGLQLEKPPGWERSLRAGMYAFINIPSISKFEWHPFTLSSAPVQDHIGFHIKCAGDWTREALHLMKDSTLESVVPGEMDSTAPVIRVEGPIGASSQGFSDHEVVVLIGAGIGVTPMVSVLRMLLTNPGKMRRAFFYWTVRDMSSFEWFDSLMEEIYEQDTKNILEIRHFLTSAKRDDRDLGAILFHYAANAVHADANLDILLGHRSHQQVEVGRPDWEKELSHVIQITKELGEDDCGIFLCGPEAMAEAVSETSTKLSKKHTDFHLYFAKETF